MKQLYVLHTQYNLILGAATLLETPQAENTLVLYAEFSVTEEMTDALKRVFHRVLVANDRYISIKDPKKKQAHIRSCLARISELKTEAFDRIYLSQEEVFDRIVYQWAKKNNPRLLCCDIEEDAYYSLNPKLNIHPPKKTGLAFYVKNALFACGLWGHPYTWWEKHWCYGMSKMYQRAYLLYPALVRRELRGKTGVEITKEQLLWAIDAIYRDRQISYPESQRYMVMFFDLMSRYHNPAQVKKIVTETLTRCQEQGIQVLLKYHPRETEKFQGFENAFEIDKTIPAEKVLSDLYGKDVQVFGNATTACIVAAKLGCRVFSICKLEIPENKAMHGFMEEIGIICMETPV